LANVLDKNKSFGRKKRYVSDISAKAFRLKCQIKKNLVIKTRQVKLINIELLEIFFLDESTNNANFYLSYLGIDSINEKVQLIEM